MAQGWMRLSRVLAAAICVAGGALIARAVTPPTDGQVEAVIESIQKAGAGEQDASKRAEARREAARRGMDSVSIGEASRHQVASMRQKVGTASPELARELDARMGELVSAALDEPDIGERLRHGKGEWVAWEAAQLRVETLAERHILDRLAPLITPDVPPRVVIMLDGMAREVIANRAALGETAVETFRANMIRAIDAAHPKMVADREARLKRAAEQNKNKPNGKELMELLEQLSKPEAVEMAKMLDTKDLLGGAWARGELVGHPAPDLGLVWSSGQNAIRSWADMRGKVVLVEFWGSWSPASVASFTTMRELQRRYAGFPVVLLGVTSAQGYVQNWQDGERAGQIDCAGDPAKEHGAIADFMRAQNMTWVVVLSGKSAINPDFGVRGVPEVAIIDSKGVVRFAQMLVNGRDQAAKVDALLREAELPCPSMPYIEPAKPPAGKGGGSAAPRP